MHDKDIKQHSKQAHCCHLSIVIVAWVSVLAVCRIEVIIHNSGAVKGGSAHCHELSLVTQLGVLHITHHQVVPYDVSRHHRIHHQALQCAGQSFVAGCKHGDVGVGAVKEPE